MPSVAIEISFYLISFYIDPENPLTVPQLALESVKQPRDLSKKFSSQYS
jgi:hypothetical protein